MRRRARIDPRSAVRIVRRKALRYGMPAVEGLDLGPHVRAASALVRRSDRLYVVQDDTAAIASVSLDGGSVRALPLSATDGQRRFDTTHGNKQRKRDLEAACLLDLGGVPTLVAFGSGSSPLRESVALVALVGESVVSPPPGFVALPRLYAALRARTDFAGSELNVEGVIAMDDELWLAQRGNGAPAGALQPVSAIATLSLAGFVALLAAPDTAEVPPLLTVEPWELGTIDGAPLTFTDLAATPAGVLFAAAAEASPDALRDGPVAGVVVGRVADGVSARVVDEQGVFSRDKIEGIVHADHGRLYAVVDCDDPDVSAALLELALPPEWRAGDADRSTRGEGETLTA